MSSWSHILPSIREDVGSKPAPGDPSHYKSDSDINFDSGSESGSSESDSTSTNSSGRSPPLFITDVVADGLTHDFLLWLGQGPEAVIEQTVKGRRMTTEKQLAPIRLNLRFLLSAVGSSGSPSQPIADHVSLSTLVEVDSIKAIMTQLHHVKSLPETDCHYSLSRRSSNDALSAGLCTTARP